MTMRHMASVELDIMQGAAMVEDSGNAISTSRRVRMVDFYSDWLKGRAREMHLAKTIGNPYRSADGQSDTCDCEDCTTTIPAHRKIWEYCAIAQVFMERVAPRGLNAAALGFGCGNEPLPAWMTDHNVHSMPYEVIATDGPLDPAWTSTGQHASNRADDGSAFHTVDMRYLSSDLLGGCFDFTWSCSSMEHIGGIEAGITFFCEQMKALRRGGVAAHTTEFNPDSVLSWKPGDLQIIQGSLTLDAANLCLFRASDLLELERRLALQGDKLWALDLAPGTLPEDLYIDSEPYDPSAISHLNISICGGQWQTTSVLLVAERGGAA